jgi:MYXO-CTERM domain-containing protein
VRWWLVAAVVIAAPPARGGRLQRIGPCLVDPDAVAAVVDARIVRIEQPTHGCVAASVDALDPILYEILIGAPTSSTGCVVGTESPHCAHSLDGEGPEQIDVTVDGAVRRTPYVAGMWQACDLAPGAHAIELCTPRGPVTCHVTTRANARTGLAITSTEGRVRARVENSRHGTLRAGTELDIALDADPPLDRIELPPQVTLTWKPAAGIPRARVCMRPAASPGCSRCSAATAPGAGELVFLMLVMIAFGTQRRRR